MNEPQDRLREEHPRIEIASRALREVPLEIAPEIGVGDEVDIGGKLPLARKRRDVREGEVPPVPAAQVVVDVVAVHPAEIPLGEGVSELHPEAVARLFVVVVVERRVPPVLRREVEGGADGEPLLRRIADGRKEETCRPVGLYRPDQVRRIDDRDVPHAERRVGQKGVVVYVEPAFSYREAPRRNCGVARGEYPVFDLEPILAGFFHRIRDDRVIAALFLPHRVVDRSRLFLEAVIERRSGDREIPEIGRDVAFGVEGLLRPVVKDEVGGE